MCTKCQTTSSTVDDEATAPTSALAQPLLDDPATGPTSGLARPPADVLRRRVSPALSSALGSLARRDDRSGRAARQLLAALSTGDLTAIDVSDGPAATRRAQAEGTTARAVATHMRRTGARATYYDTHPRLLVLHPDVAASPPDLQEALTWGATAHRQAMHDEPWDAEGDLFSPTDLHKPQRNKFRRRIAAACRLYRRENKGAHHILERDLLTPKKPGNATQAWATGRGLKLRSDVTAGHRDSAATMLQQGAVGPVHFGVEADFRNKGTRPIEILDAGGIPIERRTLQDLYNLRMTKLGDPHFTAAERRKLLDELVTIDDWLAGPTVPGMPIEEMEYFVVSSERLAELAT